MANCHFNSSLQVKFQLWYDLNPILWQSALWHEAICEYVFTYLIKTDDLEDCRESLERGAPIEMSLHGFNYFDRDQLKAPYLASGHDLWNPTPLQVAAFRDNVPLAELY
jgi:hypothetical protein